MNGPLFPQEQAFWYLQRPPTQPLRASEQTEVIVIGGGITGLTAAQACAQKGKKVTLLEAFYCGAGATGKSSGFVTPNSELGLDAFIHQYGVEGGKTIWDAIQRGLEHIRTTIKDHSIACNYTPQDSLFVAHHPQSVTVVQQEYETLQKGGYPSRFITKDELASMINTPGYYGATLYPNSFGIDGYAYCQNLKDILTRGGVRVYEETPVLAINGNTVVTQHATVSAPHIIVCTDRFTPDFTPLTHQVYQAQTFVLASQELSEREIQTIFPHQRFLVWDTHFVYNYYRLNGNRLILGGGSMLHTYTNTPAYHSPYMYKKLTNYFRQLFPTLSIQFEQMWPGLIGVSKDMSPLIGRDADNPAIVYLIAPTGIPIGAMMGLYAAEYIFEQADYLHPYFSPYRAFPVNQTLQRVIGKKISFALSHTLKLTMP